jgi:hypothetical protein
VLSLQCDVEKLSKSRNVREKLIIGISTSDQLPHSGIGIPESAFRHQGQSDTAGQGLVQHCPAMLSSNP